jgi:hypothetical protein
VPSAIAWIGEPEPGTKSRPLWNVLQKPQFDTWRAPKPLLIGTPVANGHWTVPATSFVNVLELVEAYSLTGATFISVTE